MPYVKFMFPVNKAWYILSDLVNYNYRDDRHEIRFPNLKTCDFHLIASCQKFMEMEMEIEVFLTDCD